MDVFGGMVGVGTTMFTSLAFGGVGVTAIVGLSLLGQSITSIVVDQFGLFGARRSPFFAGKLLGLMAVLAGVCVMVFPLTGANVGAVLCALAAGVAIVVARTINAQLAERHGAMRSTVMNYVAGLATTVVLMLIAGRNDPLWTDFQLSSNWFMYLGGPVSVLLIMLMNITVNKVPALAMTLLMFSGRIFAGLGLDYVLYGSFSWQSAAGGALVACGMCLNVWMENRRNVKLAASTDDAA